ncbi:MAG: lytic transglycosylase domain-containing protein [Pseudoruegeria sp.]
MNRKKRRFGCIIISMGLVLTGPVFADSSTTQNDFTFKRVKIPGKTAGKRIKVQIDETVEWRSAPSTPRGEVKKEAAVVALAVPKTTPKLPKDMTDWFWQGVSPNIASSGPGRLSDAINQLTKAPIGKAIQAPRLQNMQDIAERYGIDILAATIGTRVSPALVLAVIGIESSGRSKATSHAGAHGLMQLMPATAERFGVKDRSIPKENIKGGVAYLDWLMKEFDNDPVLALAAYNAGENAVKKNGGVPPYSETRAYVPKVIAAWTVARGLCLTPPELATDGCVFAIRSVQTNG